MALFDDTSPPNTEGVKLGAQRIREEKTLLNTTLGLLFTAASTWVSNIIPGASIKNNEVTGTQLQSDGATDANRAVNTNHLRDNAVTAPKIAASAVSDGLVKAATNNPISVNVDAATIDFDGSTPKRIKVKDKGIGLTQMADNALAGVYVLIQDEQANNTAPQVLAASPTVRNIQTIKVNTNGIASVASNKITLPAGTYRCRISAPARNTQNHRLHLYNFTDSLTVHFGTSEFSNLSSTRSWIVGTFTLSGSKDLQIRHYVNVLSGTGGMPSNFGVNEVYTVAEFWKDA